MIKKTIKYTDFNGVERTEDFWFHLTKAEVAQLELSENGGYAEWVKSIANAGDSKTLAKIFKDIIMMAYGEKSVDGKYFRKFDNDGYKLVNNFIQTAAFSELYMELITDPDKASKFMNQILPEDMVKEAEEMRRLEQEKNHPALKQ